MMRTFALMIMILLTLGEKPWQSLANAIFLNPVHMLSQLVSERQFQAGATSRLVRLFFTAPQIYIRF